MGLIVHQALKDARLLRWLLAAWVLLLLAIHAVMVFVLNTQLIDRDALHHLSSIESWFAALAMVVFVVVGALVVQHDSPVSPTAFWLTRPVSVRKMLASKLLFALAFLVLLPLLLDAGDLLFAGLSLRWLSAQALVDQLAWLLPVMAIAAITTGLPRFVLIALFEIVLFIGVTGLAFSLGIPSLGAPLPVITAGISLLGGVLLIYLYLTRHVRSSAALFGVAPLLLCTALALSPTRAVPLEWPWGDLKDYPDAGQSGISFSLDRSSLTVIPIGGSVALEAPLTISGIPQDGQVFVAAHGWYDVGSTRIPLQRGYARLRQTEVEADGVRLMKHVLGTSTLLNPREIVWSRPSLGVTMSSADFARVKDRIGHLHADLMIGAYRYETAATVRVQPGAAFDVGNVHTDVLAIRSDDRSLALETRETGFAWVDLVGTSTVVLLRSGHLGQAVIGSSIERAGFGAGTPPYSNAAIMRVLMPVPSHVRVAWSTLVFNLEQPGAKSPRAAEWLQDGELVVASRPSAGRWRAVIDLPNVKFGDIPARPSK